MEIIPEVKACESCAKSKRKCGKESPRCHRCTSRDLECIYPLPTRPSSFVRFQDAPSSAVNSTSIPMVPAERAASIPMAPAEIGRPPPDMWDPTMALFTFTTTSSHYSASHTPNTRLDVARPSTLLSAPRSVNNPPAKQLSTDWFMSPESWKMEYIMPGPGDQGEMPPSPYSRQALKAFLTTGQGWLADWISTGGTTFIHKQLYSFKLPRCVQDAYTAVALYLLRTDENEDMVHRIIEDRSSQLLADEERHRMSSSLDPFGHLARVHALLAYQIICLLDGDIHLRGLAEQRTTVMESWLKQMLDSVSFASQLTSASGAEGAMTAARGLGLGIVDIMDAASSASASASAPAAASPATTTTTPRTAPQCFHPSSQEEVLWHTWIFAESVRRTWIFAQGLHVVYTVMLQGCATCCGSIKFTTAAEVWDAPSSYAWSKICAEKDVALTEPEEVESFLARRRPEEVDGFTTSLLQIMFGKAKMERWADARTPVAA
ncbi:hypothetical protein KVR01_011899 [Diaporthe batatas]|uniref:uncharacterized protein n=1 Tax=Diaporthe batatas TaxID=748121 RepID=UPI001D03750A|nr:uncharacterized protein KVR01_011899 [Diaporthe batatas]KAG8158138.1 hypothetical protein KVR01_011899 [Diaporthe batatas]